MAIVMVAMLAFGGTYAYFTATAGEARTATTNLGKIALDGTATKLTATSTTNALPGENIFSEDAKLTISDKSNRASYIFIEVSATVTKKGASTSEAFNLEGLDTLDTASMPMLYIDPELVMEVYENLISNAVRFAKSMIMVTLEYKEKDRVLSFVVEDDGPGFSEEALQRGTDPFYGSEKEGRVHFGLGLYICKTICRKHGGDIKTENRISDGTVIGSRVAASFVG